MEEFKDLYSVAEYFEVPDSANIAKLIAEMINVGIESEVEDNINKIDFLFGEDYKAVLETANELFKYLEEE